MGYKNVPELLAIFFGVLKLAIRLKKLRLDNGFTLREAARRVGVPVSTYRDWEYGKAIRGEPYEKLAEIFGISLEELLTGRKSENSALLEPLREAQKNIALALAVAQAL